MSWVVADDLPSTILFSFPSEGSIKIVNASQRRRRRQRRLQQHSDDKYRKLHRYIDFQQTFGFDALYQAARKCKRGVTWKNTVLNFDNRRAVNCGKLAQELEDGTYKKRAPIRFDISERGKHRHISASETGWCNAPYATTVSSPSWKAN